MHSRCSAKCPDAPRPRGASPAPGPRVATVQAPQLSPKDVPVTARNWGVPAGPALASMFPRAASGRRPGSRARRHRRQRVMARRSQSTPATDTGRSPAQPYMPCAPQLARPARSPGTQGAFPFLHQRTRLDGLTHNLSTHCDSARQEGSPAGLG
jgi:hypothetical protein